MRDAARIVLTLSPMSEGDASTLGVDGKERDWFVRIDAGKENMRPPTEAADWFRLESVPLGNSNATYPAGDSVQAIRPHHFEEAFDNFTPQQIREVLHLIDQPMDVGGLHAPAGDLIGGEEDRRVAGSPAAGRTPRRCRCHGCGGPWRWPRVR